MRSSISPKPGTLPAKSCMSMLACTTANGKSPYRKGLAMNLQARVMHRGCGVLVIGVCTFAVPGRSQTNSAESRYADRIRSANPTDDVSIRPYLIHVPEKALTDLRRRLAAMRWPESETVADLSQGVPLATMRDLVRYWQSSYDWRKVEARL